MALQDINVGSLRSAISSCKSSLKASDSKQLVSAISNDGTWNCAAKSILKDSISRLSSTSYSKLKGQLDAYEGVVGNIEQWQKLYEENQRLMAKRNDLNNKISYEKGQINDDNREQITNKITGFSNDITSITSRINENKQKMETLQRQIMSSV